MQYVSHVRARNLHPAAGCPADTFVLCLLAKCFEGGGAKRRLRETRTIFLLFLRDGSLYLPLPDIQQFIVEYLKMSENIGRIWKTSDVENLCPVT